MKTRICTENVDAKAKLPGAIEDKSGVGVHYMDAYIKPLNTKLEDGTAVSCKRKGLKLTLTFGEQKGDGLMRRFDLGPNVEVMLQACLKEAAKNAGLEFSVEDGDIYLATA